MRRPDKTTFGLVSTLLLGAAVFACSPGVAEAHRPWTDSGHQIAPYGQSVSVSIEGAHGGALPTYYHGGSTYVAGRMGERYNIRVHNHSGERVEAVVTVDGRDVVSGQLGNYKTQRGYVLEPYGSVLIEGYRQSLDTVAAFRFTDVGDSYSGRWGTPQHVGVIGVAVFKEYQPRRRPNPPAPIATRPYYDPYYDGDYGGAAGRAASEAPPPADAPAAKTAPSAQGGAVYRDEVALDYDRRSARLGTQYGETTHSSVREVTFERRHKRRPDVLMTVYYDSAENLRARGIIPDPYWTPPPPHDPRPFPYNDRDRHNQYAPPPPPRRY